MIEFLVLVGFFVVILGFGAAADSWMYHHDRRREDRERRR